MSRLVFNKFLGADYENIKQGRLKFYNWTERWKLGGKVVPTWKDIILHGTTALTLVNSKANSLGYLKLFGNIEQRNLPAGFTQVEFIQSDGTAWLDTGFIANGGMIFDGKVMPVPVNKDNMTIGSITDTGNSQQADLTRNLITYVANNNVYTPQKLNKYMTTYADAGTSPVVIHLDTTGTNFYCTVNGNVVVNETTGTLTDQTTTVKIGFSDYSRTTRKGRYYPLQFRNSNGDLVCDLVPARNSSNIVSMYDLVSNTFLPVQGTGSFTAGADVTTPTPNTPMDIVCNNGVLKVKNKNLYNPATRTEGYYIGADGVIAQGSGTFCYSALIPVKPNTNYMLSGIASQTNSRRLHAYNRNGNWISQISFANTNIGNTYNITGTTPNNCAYVRISIPMLDTNVQLEQGSTATSYEPYQAGIYADGTIETVGIDTTGDTATAEMLLKVGDYKDIQEVLTGSVTRNVGIKVLNGTEEWGTSTKYCWNLLSETRTTLNAYCTHFKMEDTIPPSSSGGSARWGKMFASSYGLALGARASSASEVGDTVFLNVDDWKNYLALQYANGTPVILVYPISSPTTETVAAQPLSIQAGTNVITANGSIDNLELEVLYKAGVSVTITQIQNVNLDNNVEVTINE